jgi:hypothetical protein
VFYIHQVFVECVESTGQQLAHVETCRWRCLEKLARILDEVKGAGFRGAHCGGVVAADQRRHLAEDNARPRRRSNQHIIFQNLDRSFGEEKEVARRLALLDDDLAAVETAHLVASK